MISKFARAVLNWYEENKRSLPWRGRGDPYAVWVSEIMLQQTRVETVIPYFERWMEQFPNIPALARASEHHVLKAWEGLGYYARGRNLRRAAQIVMRDHGGVLPHDVEVLRTLPGIGRYTAGAIASISFGRDEPALDGNIRRVLSRVFDVSVAANSPAGERRLWELAAVHLPRGRAGDYNQAMMDLGATICVAANPRCPICPVRMLCKARKLGIQAKRPVTGATKRGPHHVHAAAVVSHAGRVLLAKRPSSGLLGGMWEFPNGRVQGQPEKRLAATIRRLYGLKVKRGEKIAVVHHGYTHFTVDVHAFHCTVMSPPGSNNLKWVRVGDLEDYPMGRIDRQIARKLR